MACKEWDILLVSVIFNESWLKHSDRNQLKFNWIVFQIKREIFLTSQYPEGFVEMTNKQADAAAHRH